MELVIDLSQNQKLSLENRSYSETNSTGATQHYFSQSQDQFRAKE